MITVECVQGSQDWLDARTGACTASRFRDARERVGGLTPQQQCYVNAILDGVPKEEAVKAAGYKAAPTSELVARALAGEVVRPEMGAKALGYACLIALERIAKRPLDETFVTWQMRRGHDEEPRAREAYEVATGSLVLESGVILTDDRLFGYSTDGFVGDEGMVEIKTPSAPEKVVATWLSPSIVVEEYRDQIQGGLWLTRRQWCDLVIWTPWLRNVGKSLYVQRFERDEAYIERLEEDLMDFQRWARSYELDLRRRDEPIVSPIGGTPAATPDELPQVISAVVRAPDVFKAPANKPITGDCPVIDAIAF